MVFTGAFVYLQWVRETTFGTAATTIQSAGENFGFEQKITSWGWTNNKIPLAQLNDVRIKNFAYGTSRGSLSVDFVLSSPWFLGLIGFKDGTTTGSGPYTHTWALDATSATETVQGFTTQIGQESGSTDIVRTLKGGIINSASISASIGEVVRVTLDANYANEQETATLDTTPDSISVCEHIPYTFAHASLEFPDCTTIAEVQVINITFSQNPDHLYGMGTSVAGSAFRKLFEITGSFKTSWTDSVQLVKLFTQQKDTLCNSTCGCETILYEQPTLKITFTNGLASTATRSLVISLAGISLADHNLSIEPNEPIFEELNFQARTGSAVAVNNVTTIPASA